MKCNADQSNQPNVHALDIHACYADLVTGIYHWLLDNYGDSSTPLVGSQIEDFQNHHEQPWFITDCEFCNNVHKVTIRWKLAACALTLSYISKRHKIYARHLNLGTTVQCLLVSRDAFALHTQQTLLLFELAMEHFQCCHCCFQTSTSILTCTYQV